MSRNIIKLKKIQISNSTAQSTRPWQIQSIFTAVFYVKLANKSIETIWIVMPEAQWPQWLFNYMAPDQNFLYTSRQTREIEFQIALFWTQANKKGD